MSTEIDQSAAGGAGMPLGPLENFRNSLYGKFARRGRIWHHVRRLGTWLEHELDRTQGPDSEVASIDLDSHGRPVVFRLGKRRQDIKPLVAFRQVWSFLNWLGVRRLELQTRLERNQVEDVFTLLYRHRRKLARRDESPPGKAVLSHLLGPAGVHVACTRTRLNGSTLSIDYSYCALTFSRAVRWFEGSYTTFSDHRTIFQAAPRVGLLFGLIAAGPTLVVSWNRGATDLAAVGIVEGLLVFALTYVLFMIIGSVEYDNEEKAHRLRLANDSLQRYADRVQSDIQRARDVQQRFLPKLDDGSLPENLSWASCFMPEAAVGGDFFDVHRLDDRRVAILFSDVSGHGMSSAFISAVLKTTFQGWVARPTDLPDLLVQLNTALCKTTPEGSFAAVFLAILDSQSGRLDYANAGHQPEPWIVPADATAPLRSLADARSMILGIVEDTVPAVRNVTLQAGDTVLMASDGVVENLDVDGQIYGVDRFVRFVETQRDGRSVGELMDRLIDEVTTFSQDADVNDDRTMLAFTYTSK